MEQSSVSGWMQTANYGRAIASRAARYSARYYRIIIAALVIMLLILETVYTNPFLVALTLSGILLYAAYVVGRLLLPPRWMDRYYAPRTQLLRAQAGIFSLTFLLAGYAFFHQTTSLWVLYLLAAMIVSEHCSTSALLLTVGEIDLLLIGLGYPGSGLPLAAYLLFSPALVTASLQALAILLLSFLLHYLVRNVEARDTTIARYRRMLNGLAVNIRILHDPQAVRMLVLNTFQAIHRAACGSIWILDKLIPATMQACKCSQSQPAGGYAPLLRRGLQPRRVCSGEGNSRIVAMRDAESGVTDPFGAMG